ncbi:MAG: FMN-binding negative transcriptional regulator, partial [Janthinobacterium lividum]
MAMYVPRQFREERPDVLAHAMRGIQFAVLVTPGPEGLQVSHVPMVLKEAGDGSWTLETHVARPNPHWTLAAAGAASVAVFQGPQAYVSPSWYATKREHGKVVPTWNYIAVHAHGQLEAVEDPAWLLAHLDELTRANEAGREHPWEVSDAPADFVQGLTRAIIGLRLPVARVEGAWKMIQHRAEGDRLGTIGGLEADPHGRAVAEVMRGLEVARAQAGV